METIAGLITGLTQTIVFNPIDRAMYLHVIKKNRFTNSSNWKHPYQGVSNAVFGKTLSYGLYYALIDYSRQLSSSVTNTENTKNLLAGIMTGTATGIILNPLNAVKYHAWGKDGQTLRETAKMMHQNNFRCFIRGMLATIQRDAVFSSIYAVCQPIIKKHTVGNQPLYVGATLVMVSTATLFSAPFNYIRNHRYSECVKLNPPSYKQIVSELLSCTIENNNPIRYLMYRLCIGWGTLRVAVGITSGQIIYDCLVSKLNHVNNSGKSE